MRKLGDAARLAAVSCARVRRHEAFSHRVRVCCLGGAIVQGGSRACRVDSHRQLLTAWDGKYSKRMD